MKRKSVRRGFRLRMLAGLCVSLQVAAQETPGSSTTAESKQTEPAKSGATANKHEGNKSNSDGVVKLSTGVDEILKMVQAGVSAEVIRTYIENSPIAYNLNANDIIALKEHGVPDDLTKTMVKRGATLRGQVEQANNSTPVPPAGWRNQRATMDPESYDYFQYYYLYPRTLAAANQRLYGSPGGFYDYPFYGYGSYGPLLARPQSPFAFRR